MKKKNFMSREKFFWVNPSLYNAREWPFKTRYAIGVRLADFRARNEKVFRFLIKGKMYSIPRDMAFKYGLKYMIPIGTLPNLIPLDLFEVKDMDKFYQLQKNDTLHLIEVSPKGGKRYIPFIPNLDIPIVKSKHRKVLEAERDYKAVQNGTLFGN